MFYENRSKDELIRELAQLQQKITELEEKEIERIKAEEQLRKEMDFTMKMIHTSPTFFVTLSPDLKTMLMNETILKALGYKAQEVVGRNFLEVFIIPEKQTEVSHLFDEIKHLHEARINEFPILTKTKEEVLVEWYCNAVLKEDQDIDYILGVGVDITKRRKMEEALRESEEKFRTLAEESPNMIFINKAGKVVYANKRCEEVMGYTQKEFYDPNFNFVNLIAPEYKEIVAAAMTKHMQGQDIAPYEYALITKSGVRIEALLTPKIIEYEGDIAILGIVTDITERKNYEKKITESEEKYRKLIEQSLQGLVIMQDFRIVLANDAFAKICQYTIDELLNLPPEKIQALVHPDYQQTVWGRFKDRLAGIETPEYYEFIGVRKDGSHCWLEMFAKAVSFQEKPAVQATFVDITARKQAEILLRESEQKYRTLVEGSLQGILIIQDGHVVFANSAFEEISGYTVDELLQLTPEQVQACVHPDYQETVWGRLKDRLAGKDVPDHYEFLGIRKDGSTRWLELFVQIIDYEGKPAVQCVMIDITDRKETHIALEQTEVKFRTIFDCASDAIFIHNLDGKFLEVNETACKRLGFSRDELLAMTPMDIDTDEYAPLYPQRIKDLKEGGQTFFETAHMTKDGREITVELSSRIIEYEGKPAVLSIARDISERKLMEQNLQASEKKYRNLVDNALVGVYKSNLEGAFLYANEALAAMFEYETPEGMLKDGALKLYRHPEDRKKFINTIREKGRVSYFEMELLTKNGHPRHVLVSASLEGDVLSGMIMDITKRKTMEKELKDNVTKLQELMESTVHSMARILETRDPYTAGHQKRVAQLAVAIAKKMNLSENQIRGLHMAAIIHDIGKIYIPAEILTRPSALTKSEFALIKTHPQVGHDILKKVEFPWPVAVIVLQHHERFNGSGYPQGIKEKNIILEARILAVADVVEAMSSHRPYRPAKSMEETMEEITNNKGKLYDPAVAEMCSTLFSQHDFAFNLTVS